MAAQAAKRAAPTPAAAAIATSKRPTQNEPVETTES